MSIRKFWRRFRIMLWKKGMTLKYLIVSIVFALSCGCVSEYGACDDVRNPDIRKEYMAVLSSKPTAESAIQKKAIECAFNNMVIDEIVSKKEFHGIVQDELGNILSDYKLEVHWNIYNDRNRIESQKVFEKQMSNQGFIVKWTNSPDVVNILVQKSGYQNQAVNFKKKSNQKFEIYLKSGQLKPSVIEGEYVITLRPSNIWGPYEKEGNTIPKRMWPKEIPENTRIVSNSIDPWIIVAPKSGVYILNDNNNLIYKVRKVNEGEDIGFEIVESKWLIAECSGDSSRLDINEKVKYYEWRYFDQPKIMNDIIEDNHRDVSNEKDIIEEP